MRAHAVQVLDDMIVTECIMSLVYEDRVFLTLTCAHTMSCKREKRVLLSSVVQNLISDDSYASKELIRI